jgi:Ca-activated chloride channel family protein
VIGWDALTLEWPWALLLGPLPLVIRRWAPPVAQSVRAVPVPFGVPAAAFSSGGGRQRVRASVAWICWLLLVLAAADPQWAGEPIELGRSGRNLMLAVDLSGSMKEEDLELNGQPASRLAVVKSVLGPFIERRSGDRLGLILFGDEAYLQTPLTFDRETVAQMLQESAIGLAGERTAIGSAIGLGVRHLRDLPEAQRVMILLTDGRNTAGELSPEEALKLAVETGVRIHTIGVGADELLVRTLFGMRRLNPSAELDERLLQKLASETGGEYFRARETRELEQIYATLDAIEPVRQGTEVYRPMTALFFWPLGLAVLLGLSLGLASFFPVVREQLSLQKGKA